MIPRFQPQYGLLDILFALRPEKDPIGNFENNFASLAKTSFAVAFPYGRTGLFALLKCLGFKNKEIICPAYTCVVVAHAIKMSGNTPVFIDSRATDFNMEIDALRKKISPNTAAVVATSIFGHPVNLDQLNSLKTEYPNLVILQDCAHSFFCEHNGQPVHRAGIAAFYGMNISKILHCVSGGMVTTDDEILYKKLKDFQTNGLKKTPLGKNFSQFIYALASWIAFKPLFYNFVFFLQKKGFLNKLTKYYDEYKIDLPQDFDFQISSYDAKIGSCLINRYSEIVQTRRRCAKIYHSSLSGISGLTLPPWSDGATFSHYVVRTDSAKQLHRFLQKKCVQAGELIEYVVPNLRAYNEDTSYPISSGFVGKTLNLTVSNYDHAEKTLRAVREFYA